MAQDEEKHLVVAEGVDTEKPDGEPPKDDSPHTDSVPAAGPFDNATDDNGSLLSSGQVERPPQPGQQTSVGEG